MAAGVTTRLMGISGKKQNMDDKLRDMVNADAQAAAKTPSFDQQIEAQQLVIDAAYQAEDYGKLAIASQMMLKLKNDQSKAEAHKLETKLQSELAEVLEAYMMELAPYNEIRGFINEGVLIGVVLMNVVAQAPKSKPKADKPTSITVKWQVHGVEHELSTTPNGLPTTDSLLALVGGELLAKDFKAGGVEFKAGTSFNDVFVQAKSAPDKNNADYQARKRLLTHVST
jgi:hypothetical protein